MLECWIIPFTLADIPHPWPTKSAVQELEIGNFYYLVNGWVQKAVETAIDEDLTQMPLTQ